MKKVFFLMLSLIVLGAASAKAQVTIGANTDPHSGAVLDLQSTTQGLKLPTVALDNDLTNFKLTLSGTSTKANAKGMYVYNTNTAIGEGVYVWDGNQWLLVKESIGTVPVTSVAIAPTAIDSLTAIPGGTIQLRATISPDNASNKHVTWSIVGGNTHATVDGNGLVTAISNGRAAVRATASNGTYVDISVNVIDINAFGTEVIGSNSYHVARFGTKVWMAENMKNVPAVGTYYTAYNGVGIPDASVNSGLPLPAGERGYYYSRESANVICPTPWRLPTLDDCVEYKSTREDYWLAFNHHALIDPLIARGGEYLSGEWHSWNSARFFVNTNYKANMQGTDVIAWALASTNFCSVRCLRDAY
jgi:hypothetical protein